MTNFSPFRQPQHGPRLATLVLVGALASAGCVVSSESRVTYDGRYVSPATLEQIQPGASPEFVAAVLGEPTSRTPIGESSDREIWRWSYSRRTNSDEAVLFLLATSREIEERGAVYVEFKKGRVLRSWSEE